MVDGAQFLERRLRHSDQMSQSLSEFRSKIVVEPVTIGDDVVVVQVVFQSLEVPQMDILNLLYAQILFFDGENIMETY